MEMELARMRDSLPSGSGGARRPALEAEDAEIADPAQGTAEGNVDGRGGAQ